MISVRLEQDAAHRGTSTPHPHPVSKATETVRLELTTSLDSDWPVADSAGTRLQKAQRQPMFLSQLWEIVITDSYAIIFKIYNNDYLVNSIG